MAETPNFGDPNCSESFMLKRGFYDVHTDENLQALVFPVMAFETPGPEDFEEETGVRQALGETIGYLAERDMWLTASIDASKPNIGGTVAYQLASTRSSVFGRAIEAIKQDVEDKVLTADNLESMRESMIQCSFEDHPLYRYVQRIMDTPPPDAHAMSTEKPEE